MQKIMQIKDYLLELSFLALLIKVIITGAGIGEAIAIVSLVSSMGYNKWLNKQKVEQYDELKELINTYTSESDKKFDNIMARINTQNMESTLFKRGPDINELASKISRIDEVLNEKKNNPGTAGKRLF